MLQRLVIGVGILVALLLAANLLKGFAPVWFEGQEDPRGFLTKENFVAAAYWIPVGGGLLLTLLGAYWAGTAYAEHESRGALWLRRVLVAGFVGLVGFAGATFDPEMFDRMALAVVAGWALLLVVTPAAIGAWRSNRKGGHGKGKSRGKRKRKVKPSSTHPPEGDEHAEAEREGAEIDA